VLRAGGRDRRPLAISIVFALLLVGSVALAQRVGQASCGSILVASSNEKSSLLTALAAEYSSSHPTGPQCGPVVRVERIASGDAENRLDAGWTGATRPDVWAPQASTWVYLLRARLASAARPQLIPDTPLPSLANSPLVVAMPRPGQRTLGFSLRAAIGADYSCMAESGLRPFQPADQRRDFGPPAVASIDGDWWLARRGEPLMKVAAMKIKGLHKAANALAALALGEALALPLPAMLAELAEFPGLPHRSQWVADVNGVAYINDSKGTNVGATLAAVGGMRGPLVMIAGGDGKNQDFAPLAEAFRGKVRHTVLIGHDARAIGLALQGVCAVEFCGTMEEAVRAAARAAKPGDVVLLSPACASLDMFRDYTHRGAVFTQAVKELAA